MDRIQIEIKLNRGRADALEALVAMDEEELRRPLTRSEHDPESWWSYADHFIHTTLIERNFNQMIRRHIRGEQGMDRALVDEGGKALRSREDVMSYVHALTEKWKVDNEGKSVEELVRIGLAVRAETLALLAELDDEQLASKIPGAPWSDGTVGGIMAVHTDHGLMHQRWAAEGASSTAPA